VKRNAALACLLLATLAAPAAVAKEIRTTVCGADGCTPARPALSGVATARGDVGVPKPGRYFVIRIGSGGFAICLLHERSRGLVRALDDGTAATLGRGWRPHGRAAGALRPCHGRACRVLVADHGAGRAPAMPVK